METCECASIADDQRESKEMPWILNDGNNYSWEKDIKPIYLHLELTNKWLDEAQRETLKKYGNSSTGYSISRDILIPSDMPLHALHYAIQKLFGWQNSHLRSFHLPEEINQAMTGGTVKGWAAMSGVLYHGAGDESDDRFWDDDYQEGSFKIWLRKKYTGPYVYEGDCEHYESAQAANRQNLYEDHRLIKVRAKTEWDSKTQRFINESKILREAPVMELTLEELNNSVSMEQDLSDLLERLEVISVLALEGDALARVDQIGKRRVHPRYERGTQTLEPEVLPITHMLHYHYDYGDNWQVAITRPKDCQNLLDTRCLLEGSLAEAKAIVKLKHRPVCLYRDGVSVMDDVGGMSGFADFLRTIYEGSDVDERRSMREWASSMGWSTHKVADKSIL